MKRAAFGPRVVTGLTARRLMIRSFIETRTTIMKAIIYSDASVETPGVDFGPKGLTLWAINRECVTFRTSGHSSWSGRGEASYRPVSFIVCRFTDVTVDGSIIRMTCDELTWFDAKRDAQVAMAAMRIATSLTNEA